MDGQDDSSATSRPARAVPCRAMGGPGNVVHDITPRRRRPLLALHPGHGGSNRGQAFAGARRLRKQSARCPFLASTQLGRASRWRRSILEMAPLDSRDGAARFSRRRGGSCVAQGPVVDASSMNALPPRRQVAGDVSPGPHDGSPPSKIRSFAISDGIQSRPHLIVHMQMALSATKTCCLRARVQLALHARARPGLPACLLGATHPALHTAAHCRM
ncbi:hypothetical protein CDD83_10389 [Cordyceps sp. RAO-2017]|nr:hypothetical protein CDD83_10389 [Cordyceps sp. RAO-2017]